MPISTGKAAFKSVMKAHLESMAANPDPEKANSIDEYLDALADAIEAYIQNGLIVPTTMTNSGGPVTGTGNIQ